MNLVSAACAPDESAAALRFALRVVAAALFATAVAVAPPRSHGRALAALVVSTGVVAVLAISEAAGSAFFDPFLALFRESWVVVGAVRRATAGSPHPNLAGAFLAYGLVATAALAAGTNRATPGATANGHAPGRLPGVLVALALTALLGLGLLSTYSRGAWLAAGAGLAIMTVALLWRVPGASAPPAAALVLLAAGAVVLAPQGSTLRLRLTMDGTPGWYEARYEPPAAGVSLAPGELRPMAVRVTNTGRQTWTREAGFVLAYHVHDEVGRQVGGAFGPVVPRDVEPGESVVLEVPLKAPPQEGRYVVALDMVQPNVDWFSEWGVPPGLVTLSVSRNARPVEPAGTPPERPLAHPVSVRPSRGVLWRHAIEMWRDHPVLGVGPDNFRRLVGRYAGWTSWDRRTFSNNTYVEALATVGILGLVSLVGVFLSSLSACARAIVRGTATVLPAAGCLALTTAIATHGMVDYVLAFTGHYLFFGFVVGMAAALEPPA